MKTKEEQLQSDLKYAREQRDRREEQNGILRGYNAALKHHAEKLAAECEELKNELAKYMNEDTKG